MKLLNDRLKEIGYEGKEVRGYLLSEVVFGSHLYGLSTPLSDFDYKGVYLPHPYDKFTGDYRDTIKISTGSVNAKNQPGDIDREYISLYKFLSLATDGDTLAIDMLHADGSNVLYASPLWNALVLNRKKFYTKNLKALVGYCKHQAAKYGVKGSRIAALRLVIDAISKYKSESYLYEATVDLVPVAEASEYVNFTDCEKSGKTFLDVCGKKFENKAKIGYVLDSLQKQLNAAGERALLAEKNEGVDWKALSHALRVGYQALHIYKDGDFTYPLEETKIIYSVKKGLVDFSEVSKILEDLIAEVEVAANNSDYPEKIERTNWNSWLWQIYLEQIKDLNTD